jgi:hypothetical protein
MAKRILSADSALMPTTQISLAPSVRTETHGGFLARLQERWSSALSLPGGGLLFDWEDKRALMGEIEFINGAQAAVDEAAVKLAPSMLRVVLTVKSNLPTPAEQRAFLAEHMRMDFRRISELCIVADSYGLLDADCRREGERELQKYGWSNALKLAYVRDPHDRRDIWERACGGKPTASYRAVLQEIRHFRERKLIAPPAPAEEIEERLGAVRKLFSTFNGAAKHLHSREEIREALQELERVQRELGQLKRALKDQFEAAEVEDLAASA